MYGHVVIQKSLLMENEGNKQKPGLVNLLLVSAERKIP